ncbi:MAG: AMP-binding protein, partial [bacterium]|nr:AMP-binding protein [bacterium]
MVDEYPQGLRAVRQLLAGGDVLFPQQVRRVLEELPGCTVINGYGPTENTTFTCCSPMRVPGQVTESVSIGRPIANTRVVVLDRQLQPVGIGVPGELCTGDAGLARGYLNRPALTAERFIPDALSAASDRRAAGARLYRTGDLVRRLADGRLEFMERIDHQVKLRGFRIELGEIEAVLSRHPAVRETVVLLREHLPAGRGAGDSGDRRLAAYVVPDPAWPGDGASDSAPQGDLGGEQVADWGVLFDDLYRREPTEADPSFNIIGWESSYTDAPLPAQEMREWLEDTVGRILSLEPCRVLEIGCGTGMLLWRIAPRCEQYVGTDISREALSFLRQQLAGPDGDRLPQVRLEQRPADSFEGFAADSLDTVILNSVVQYFPSVDYLAEVLTGAVEAVRPGGTVFVGDVRSLPLNEAFHASVELYKAAAELPCAELRRQVGTRLVEDNELVVDPAFFLALGRHLPKLGRVEIHPKWGRAHNQLTGFRYQVVLHVGTDAGEERIAWSDWRREGLDLPAVRDLLRHDAPATLAFENVPNPRVAQAAAVARLIRQGDGPATVGQLREQLAAAVAPGIEPEDFRALAEGLPYEVELGWAQPGTDGAYEVVLRRRSPGDPAVRKPLPALRKVAVQVPWSRYGNNPLQGKLARKVVPELRSFLSEKLPDYMVPAAFVLLDAFPLTPNDKVDRGALPAPELTRPELEEAFVAPRTPLEQQLADIWAEVLGVEQVGVDDDFFELGGHSLMATQLVSRVRDVFRVELPLRAVFESPRVAAMAAALPVAGSKALGPPLVRVPREGDLPVSFAQQRLWFIDRLVPENPFYNMYGAYRLQGSLDAAALRRAFTEIVRRHESLRTTFRSQAGEPRQVIAPPVPLPVPLVDLRRLSEARRGDELARLSTAEARRPFDITADLLLRTTLLWLTAMPDRDEHVLFINVHHITSDGWSTGIFFDELVTLYEACALGASAVSALEELPIQYADFAVWQRSWLAGEVLEEQLAYWRQQLAGAPEVLALPLDHPRPAIETFQGSIHPLRIPAPMARGLKALGRQRGSTPSMTVLAAFKTLLYRYSGQADIVVGTAVANRTRSEIEKLIGFFVNTLVLRTDLGGAPAFRDLLARMRETALGAYSHQDLPFEKLVEELNLERHLSRNPLCQVMFGYHNFPSSRVEIRGVSIASLGRAELDTGTSKFDLTLFLNEAGEEIRGDLEYNSDLFDRATIERLQGHWQCLLAGIVAAPGRRITELSLLSRDERHQLLVEWNDSRVGDPPSRTLDRLFAEAAARHPEVTAVAGEGRQLSYGELDRRAHRLAHHLRSMGVGPEVPVGIYLERSPEMVLAMLAILKAGGIFVPLDPAHPRDRLLLIMEDSGITVVLTREAPDRELPEAAGRRFSDLDRLLSLPGSEAPLDAGTTVGNVAYALYTSGSTGRPKGVACPHAGVINLLDDFTSRVPLAVGDACSWWTSATFDVSVYEIFSALVAGGTLQVVPERVWADGPRFVEWLNRERIRSAYVTPSMLQDLAEFPRRGTNGEYPGARPRELAWRRWRVGVEPIPESRREAIREAVPGLGI